MRASYLLATRVWILPLLFRLQLLLQVTEAFVLPRAANHLPKTRLFASSNFNKNDDNDDGMIVMDADDMSRRNLVINTLAGGLLAASGVATWQLYKMEVYTPSGFVRLPQTQFIAALADPTASQGTGAESWGLWRQDPGPRGVWLRDYEHDLVQSNGVAPRGWKFNKNDYWIEEHGTQDASSFIVDM